MLGQSSGNIGLSNHIGSFEFAGWQEIDDGSLERAGWLSAQPDPAISKVICPRGPAKIDDGDLE